MTIHQILPVDSTEEYTSTLQTIISKIKAAQARAAKTVNLELVSVYRDIGQIIHEKQETAGWGTSIVEKLAKDLKNLFPYEGLLFSQPMDHEGFIYFLPGS